MLWVLFVVPLYRNVMGRKQLVCSLLYKHNCEGGEKNKKATECLQRQQKHFSLILGKQKTNPCSRLSPLSAPARHDARDCT